MRHAFYLHAQLQIGSNQPPESVSGTCKECSFALRGDFLVGRGLWDPFASMV